MIGEDGENGIIVLLIAHVPRACFLGPNISWTHVEETNLINTLRHILRWILENHDLSGSQLILYGN
jgi:hypothetical protein